ncbi:MAG: VWA domain-containing protein [Sandaracinaceae bacterium]|nr:VWA domain-containing protein [Sandaracinaceae bacterium]
MMRHAMMRHAVMRSVSGAASAASWLGALVLLVAGCGSKSGLTIPEPPHDDAAIDAPRPDASDFVPPDVCIELPPSEPPQEITVSFLTRISEADVFFLVDVTGSMMEEIEQIRSRLSDTIAPGIAASIPDVQFSLAEYAEFPVDGYGDPSDTPYHLITTSTPDLPTLQRGLDSLVLLSGGDAPESAIEALYLTATGENLGVLVPSRRCVVDTVGYPCFRRTGSRIFVWITDAPSHNGPFGEYPYGPEVAPRPHGYDETITALRRIGAKVLGLYSGFGPEDRTHVEEVARRTGAVTASGEPLVFDIGSDGAGLGRGVVEAVRTLVDEVPIDITIRNDDEPGDELDATMFVRGVETIAAEPPIGAIQGADRFDDVRPGTRVSFRVLFANERIARGAEPIRYRLRVTLVGDGVTELATTVVDVVIPALDGQGCD